MNLVTPCQLTLKRTMAYHCSLLKSLLNPNPYPLPNQHCPCPYSASTEKNQETHIYHCSSICPCPYLEFAQWMAPCVYVHETHVLAFGGIMYLVIVWDTNQPALQRVSLVSRSGILGLKLQVDKNTDMVMKLPCRVSGQVD